MSTVNIGDKGIHLFSLKMKPKTKKRPRAHIPHRKLANIRWAAKSGCSDAELLRLIHASIDIHSPSGNDEMAAAWDIRSQLPGVFLDCPVSVLVTYNMKEETVQGTIIEIEGDVPVYVQDGDNLDKFLFDALQKSGVIKNDRQIVRWSGQKI